MPTFKGPEADRIRGYMFDSGEGVWLCPGLTGLPPFISPRWVKIDDHAELTEKEADHAYRVLQLIEDSNAYI